MKIFLLVTKSETVLTFRKRLIHKLLQNGHTVGVIAHDADRAADIAALGVKFYCVEQDNRGLNPFSILQYQRKIRQILGQEKPDMVFTFQLKPNTFGVLAARAAGAPKIFCMVEGAGDVFINQSLKWKLVRFVVCLLYRWAFRYAGRVFFLNRDDLAEFTGRKLVDPQKCEVINGIGVDLEHFACKPVKNRRTFLMVARMLKTKGIWDYCKCARLVRQKYPDAVFHYLGAEGSVTLEDIREYLEDGSICYLGTTRDVRPYLEDCTALVLPSYREGVPMSVMEAESVGRGIITCDTVGCRDTVTDGYNGYLVPCKDYEALAQKCCYLIENPEEAVRMGENSRRFAEERFDQRKINQKLVEILEQA